MVNEINVKSIETFIFECNQYYNENKNKCNNYFKIFYICSFKYKKYYNWNINKSNNILKIVRYTF